MAVDAPIFYETMSDVIDRMSEVFLPGTISLQFIHTNPNLNSLNKPSLHCYIQEHIYFSLTPHHCPITHEMQMENSSSCSRHMLSRKVHL